MSGTLLSLGQVLKYLQNIGGSGQHGATPAQLRLRIKKVYLCAMVAF
jgi:hypothetical protein